MAPQRTSKSSRRPVRPFDKFEYSPNNTSRCQICKKRITKPSIRIGIQNYSLTSQTWKPLYFHKTCCPKDKLTALKIHPTRRRGDSHGRNDGFPTLAAEIEKFEEELTSERNLVRVRVDLERLRSAFARRLRVGKVIIFNNATLDDIVKKLPRSIDELMDCVGIGESKRRNFGDSILRVIDAVIPCSPEPEVRIRVVEETPEKSATCIQTLGCWTPSIVSMGDESPSPMSLRRSSVRLSVKRKLRVSCLNGDEEDIDVEETLSVEDIVSKKFREAEEKGYVIEIDLE